MPYLLEYHHSCLLDSCSIVCLLLRPDRPTQLLRLQTRCKQAQQQGCCWTQHTATASCCLGQVGGCCAVVARCVLGELASGFLYTSLSLSAASPACGTAALARCCQLQSGVVLLAESSVTSTDCSIPKGATDHRQCGRGISY